MPKIWNETIEEHRKAVREATLKAAAALASKHGLRGVTMSQIAETAGIGRATLYKYFPDVESILAAWHEQQVAGHVEYLRDLAQSEGRAAVRLEAVLEAYATIQHEHPADSLVSQLHQGTNVEHARQHLRGFLKGLIGEAAKAGDVRSDVAPEELANYCLHALDAARGLPSRPAVRRLVTVTLQGLGLTR